MSLGGILFLVVAVLSLFGFIYLVVITARSWGVLHTILVCLLFIECWTFLIFSAGVHENRLKWLKEATTQAKKATDLDKKTRELIWGDENAAAASSEALVPVRAKLSRLTFDRGRVWRNVSLIDQQNGQLRLQLSSKTVAAPDATALEGLDPATPAPAAPPASSQSLPVGMVVYGFSQTEDDKGRGIPDRYLGEFTVVESNAGQILLKMTMPLEPNQQQWIQSGEATEWTLYELLPLDNHESFAAEESTSTEDALFGRMDQETVEKLFEPIPEDNARRERTISSYMRDGQPASDDDPPAAVWNRIEITKDHQVDVDSKEDANATVGGYFDSSGRTVDVRLKRDDSQPVVLKEGTKLVVSEAAARELIDKGVAKLIQRIYVRPLNAYEKAFGYMSVRRDEVDKRTLVYKRETGVLQEANQLGQTMISERQVEHQKLTADLGQYKREVEFITAQAKSLADKFASTKAELLQMYNSLHAEHARITKATVQ